MSESTNPKKKSDDGNVLTVRKTLIELDRLSRSFADLTDRPDNVGFRLYVGEEAR